MASIRVMMIDDDEDDFEIVRDRLSRGRFPNYLTTWADSFDEGLKHLRAGDADIFLLDYQLGEKNGLELLREAGGPNLLKPVIMLTGMDVPELDLEALEAGASYYLQKTSLNLNHVLDRAIRYVLKSAHDLEQVRNLYQIRLESEAARAANQAKSLFLAGVSHEIRTPLAAILGFTDLAIEAEDEGRRVGFLKIIQKNAQHLLFLVNDLLDLEKVEAGRYEVTSAPCAWRRVIQEVFDTLEASATANGDRLITRFGLDIPDTIATDEHAFKQILINLISNAVKFTNNGTIEVAVENASPLQILIKDDGIGMSPLQQERLFQPFVQAQSDTFKKFGGSGLGLYLSRRLAEALGGTLELVRSHEGQGSEFCLSLPANYLRESSPASLPKKDVLPSLKGLAILVAEDSEDNQTLIGHNLREAGAKVEIAENGKAAVDRAMRGNFDVILMDIQMPHMDGVEATKTLRARGLKTPVVALSAHAMEDHSASARDAGFTDYLTKPIHFPQLIKTLSRYAR